MSNTFGRLFTLTTFGESHGPAIGGIVDGMPAGIDVDMDFIQHELDRRRPGQSHLTTSRNEADRVEILSGVFEGKTTGAPIGFLVRNEDHRSSDYNAMKDLYRPSHADFTYECKYGIRDHRGGGRSSARVTISRVVGGAFAKLVLRRMGITVEGYTSQVGPVALAHDYWKYDLSLAESNAVRCPDEAKAVEMEQLIEQVKAAGDTIGGTVSCVVKGCPTGLGEPEFGKLQAQLASAMMGINAAKGFEYGDGFAELDKRGSQLNDAFLPADDQKGRKVSLASNHSGGIQGGISNGEDIYFRVAFKPVATLLKAQQTVDSEGKTATLTAKGRHDPCVLPRAVPIVEAMAAMVVLDCLRQNGTVKSVFFHK
ncbi:MAG: chorismate synthase [Prevotella sp.]|nr:chorismate synthase [Prevotella sp.]